MFINFNSARRLPHDFLGFLLRSRVGGRFSLAGPGLQNVGTSSIGGVIDGLTTKRTGQNRDGRDWDVALKAGDG
jgi:hypothetical protein